MLVVNHIGAGPEMTVLGPDVLSVSAGHRYPWILQAVFAQGQDTALTCKLSLCGPQGHDCLRLGEERMLLPFFVLRLQAAPQYK